MSVAFQMHNDQVFMYLCDVLNTEEEILKIV